MVFPSALVILHEVVSAIVQLIVADPPAGTGSLLIVNTEAEGAGCVMLTLTVSFAVQQVPLEADP
jgi:hypothetical protein